MSVSYTYEELLAKNKQYLWNPFTQMKEYVADRPVIIESAKGRKLRDVEGREYWDGVSSIWLNVHGHRVEALDEAIRNQLEKVAHSTLLGMANVPAILLAEKLIQLAPTGLHKVFYSDSGAEAVEIAVKMAFQYWLHKGHPEKHAFITMKEAYHGDTIGAVSVGAIDLYHAAFGPLLFPTFRTPFPNSYRSPDKEDVAKVSLAKTEALLAQNSREVAALIVEPVVQGASGIMVMPEGYMKSLRDLCDQYNVLMIADEVAVGFGRTGKMFACEHDGVTPDIMAVAKGITGGYLPLAATITSDSVYEAFLGDFSDKKTFFHGHSYTGNQLACAVALANIELMEQNHFIDDIQHKSLWIAEQLQELYRYTHVGDIRQKGMMIGIELVQDSSTAKPYPSEKRMGAQVTKRCRELGMLIRPLGDVVVFMPPLSSTKEELQEMIGILKQAILDVTEDYQ